MTAREMFLKLGFNKGSINERKYSYDSDDTCVIFELSTHRVIVIDYTDYHVGYDSICMNVELIKAISKQIEELGWNK